MPLLLLMSFCTLVFMRFSGLLPEMIKGIVFRANYALTDPTDFTQIWVPVSEQRERGLQGFYRGQLHRGRDIFLGVARC
ncbi:hypothetical protein GW17_00061627 [Ensete ventricosum]|nr:hypothetical protein GW17_00061627 [Ensete ventricosum]